MSQTFESFDAIENQCEELQEQLAAISDKTSDKALTLHCQISALEAFLVNSIHHSVAVIDAALFQYGGDLEQAQHLLDNGYAEFKDKESYARNHVENCGIWLPAEITAHIDYHALGTSLLASTACSQLSDGIVVWE